MRTRVALMAGFLLLATTIALGQGAKPEHRMATFAGGCFWCMEPPFDKVKGVISTTSGYAGGKEANPTYEEVSAGKTGHAESIQVEYDPSAVTYEQLLWVYWHNTDPTASNGQFCDHGKQYRPAIFYRNDEEKNLAWTTRKQIEKDERFAGKVVTDITPFTTFYPAEEYHQDFYMKNPARYSSYRKGCGRDQRLRELWGDEAGH